MVDRGVTGQSVNWTNNNKPGASHIYPSVCYDDVWMCNIFCEIKTVLLLSAAASALPGSRYYGRVPGTKTLERSGGIRGFFSHGQYRSGGIFSFFSRGQYMIQRWAGAWTVTSPWQIAATANILQPSVFLPFQLSNLESRPRTLYPGAVSSETH